MKQFEHEILDSEVLASETKLVQTFLHEHTLDKQTSSRIKTSSEMMESLNTLPVFKDEYWYYYKQSGSKTLFCRAKAIGEVQDGFSINDAEDDTVLHNDASLLVRMSVSPDNHYIAFLERKTAGVLQLRVKSLDSQLDMLDDIIIADVGSTIAWSADCSWIFYTKNDSALRPYQLWTKKIDTQSTEVLLLQETDARFGIIVSHIDNEVISLSSSPEVSETRIFNCDNGFWSSQILIPRSRKLNHRVFGINTSFHPTHYIIRIADKQGVYNLYSVSKYQLSLETDTSNWFTIFQSSQKSMLYDVFVTSNLIILCLKIDTLSTIKILNRFSFNALHIDLPAASAVKLNNLRVLDVDSASSNFRLIRLSYIESPVLYNYNFKDNKFCQIHPKIITSENRHISVSRTVVRSNSCGVPLTLIASNKTTQPKPCVVIAYGAYQHSLDPDYLAEWIPLINKGLIVALAHVRGGGEYGAQWHRAGIGFNKVNSFNDYNNCINYLLASPQVDSSRVGLFAVSAGALLPAYFINNRPGVVKACLVRQPFVNPYEALQNPELPLTTTDWSEFGNPLEDPEVKRFIKSYSSVQNVKCQEYPSLAVVLGENDTRISNHDAIDWINKIREYNTAQTKCLCSIVPNVGHGATHPEFEYAFWYHHLLSPAHSN